MPFALDRLSRRYLVAAQSWLIDVLVDKRTYVH